MPAHTAREIAFGNAAWWSTDRADDLHVDRALLSGIIEAALTSAHAAGLAAERARCAQIADSWATDSFVAAKIAAAIRQETP